MVDGVWVREEDAPLRPGRGIGFQFLDSEYLPIDIDHVRNKTTGEWCSEAKILVSKLQTYTEWSVSGTGLHCIGLGKIRQKQLTTQHIQFWNGRLGVPRYFWLTGNVLNDDFTKLRDCAEEFQMYASHPRMFSVKMQEELKKIDSEQAASLPPESAAPIEEQPREKTKTKTRKVVAGFDIEDFLSFYGFKVINRVKNEVGECYRVDWCPWKGGPHAGHNETTCNFIYPTSDGGLGFKCHSTGCCDESIHSVVKKLAEGEKGPYPGKIYEEKKQRTESIRGHRRATAEGRKLEHKIWLWPGYLQGNQLVHLAGESGEGKSPLTRDLIARFTSGRDWPDGSKNTAEKRGVLLLSGEDDWSTDILPHLKFAGADLSQVHEFVSTVTKDDETFDVVTALDEDVRELQKDLEKHNDIGLIVIDPITNYLGRLSMNKEDEVRPGLLMPLADLAHRFKVCILTVGHLNKTKEGSLLDRVLGARAFAGVARQTLFCINDPEEDDKFAHVIGFGRNSKVAGLKYRTKGQQFKWEGNESEVVLVEWRGLSTADIGDAVSAPVKRSEKAANKQVRVLMKTLLKNGPMPSVAVEEAIKEAGIVCTNWQRVAKGTPASSRQITGKKHRGFEWYLDTPEQAKVDKLETSVNHHNVKKG